MGKRETVNVVYAVVVDVIMVANADLVLIFPLFLPEKES